MNVYVTTNYTLARDSQHVVRVNATKEAATKQAIKDAYTAANLYDDRYIVRAYEFDRDEWLTSVQIYNEKAGVVVQEFLIECLAVGE